MYVLCWSIVYNIILMIDDGAGQRDPLELFA